ncbi:MAG: hypothetical protein IKG61_04695 [Selenomonadaceae bacterium]|nr:hypothetical protein [Selenomonadaceae bacterium]MBR6711424.1 hypothetical protein [Selenomonadaceae bacterium]
METYKKPVIASKNDKHNILIAEPTFPVAFILGDKDFNPRGSCLTSRKKLAE